MRFKPKILFVSSVLKPFITDITIIKIDTPSVIPKNEKIEITLKTFFFFWVLNFLMRLIFLL